MHSRQPPSENAILQKVENSLEQAVLELGLDWYSPRIKRQKYTYLAVDHFTEVNEYPITYSWYKWGASFPNAPAAEDAFGGSHTMYSQEAKNTDLFAVGDDELIRFFKHAIDSVPLEEYWNEHHLDFLEPFYEYHAPEEYRQMYLANIALRQVFQTAAEGISDGRQPVDEQMYEKVGQATANLQMGVMANDELSQVLNPIVEFTDVTEDVFMTLSRRDAASVTQKQLQAIIELKSIYSETIWSFPTNVLSQQTAVGPNKNRLIRWAESGLENTQNQYPDAIHGAFETCEDAGLLPDVASYPEYSDEAESLIDDLLEVTGGQYE